MPMIIDIQQVYYGPGETVKRGQFLYPVEGREHSAVPAGWLALLEAGCTL